MYFIHYILSFLYYWYQFKIASNFFEKWWWFDIMEVWRITKEWNCTLLQKRIKNEHNQISEKSQYQAEQKALTADVEKLDEQLSAVKKDEEDVEEFIRRLKKYTDVHELIEYITVDEYAADRARNIHIYYKLLEKPLKSKQRFDTAKIQ